MGKSITYCADEIRWANSSVCVFCSMIESQAWVEVSASSMIKYGPHGYPYCATQSGHNSPLSPPDNRSPPPETTAIPGRDPVAPFNRGHANYLSTLQTY